MRITKYEFENDEIAYKLGCSALMNDDLEKYCPEYCQENGFSKCWEGTWEEIKNDYKKINKVITCSITCAKNLIKQYGGKAWTEHYDRDGGLIEITNINLKGNNSKFKYSYHL